MTCLLIGITEGAAEQVESGNPSCRVQPVDTTKPAPGDPLRVLHLDPAMASSAVAALRKAEVPVLAHIPGPAVLVAATEDRTRGIPAVVGVSVWGSDLAISRDLARLSGLTESSSVVPVILGFAPGSDLGKIATDLRKHGATVTWTDADRTTAEIGITVQRSNIGEIRQALQNRTDLVWADIQPPVRLRNAASVWRCQSGETGNKPIFEHGLRGEGQIIGIMDTGIDADMCYFRDDEHGLPPVNDQVGTVVNPDQRKVLAVDFYWSRDWPDPGPFDWDDHSHGTHVAGSAAGDGADHGVHNGWDGMAPAAKLVIQDAGYRWDPCGDLPGLGCPMQSLETMLEQIWAQGARIHSNSWGDEEESWPPNRYTERTADIDRFVWNHQDLLVLFAAGNAGSWGNDTVGSPATGKNVLAVGASLHGIYNPPCPTSFSSRGWTEDGRIKPDVIAPGQNVQSAYSDFNVNTENCNQIAFSGTSMACPTVAGLSALVRQYFTAGYYPDGVADPADAFEPSAALLKATLIASAVDVSFLGCTSADPIPSRDQGWGLVQLDNALYFPGDRQHLMVFDDRDGFTDTSSLVDVRIDTVSPGPLKIVLVWTDPPSNSAAATNLVNDLDLELEGPAGHLLGNVFAEGVSVTGGQADRLNNVEVILVPDAPPGSWHITISPHTIVEGPQTFALVVTGGKTGANPSRNPRQVRRVRP